MKTILMIGKNGQVGWELQRALATVGRVIGPSHSAGKLDLQHSRKRKELSVVDDQLGSPTWVTDRISAP